MIDDPSLRAAAWAAAGVLAIVGVLRMRVLDRYVGALWGRSFLVAAVVMCGLYVVIDLAEKADALLKTKVPSHAQLVLDYYACRLPLIASQLFPMMCLAATVMTVVSLTKSNELVPMILSGRSVFRVLSPAFLAMGAVVAGAMALDEWVLPGVAIEMQVTESRVGKEKFQEKTHVFDREGTLWFYTKYNLRTRTMWDLMVDRRLPGGRTWRVKGTEAHWIAAPRSGWVVTEGVEWTVDPRGGIEGNARSFGKEGVLVPSQFSPEQVETFDNPFRPLEELAREALAHPDDPAPLVRFHSRLVFPLFNLILPCLGLAVMLRREVRSQMLGFGVCLAVGIVFFGAWIFFVNLGTKGGLDPVAASWAPVVLFSSAALWLLGGVRT